MNLPDTRSCPYCGGEIKTAAAICKHCKQPVPAPGAAPRLSGVDAEVQQLLVSRGLLTETQFDSALTRRGQGDRDLLEFLSGQGLITGAQAQNVRASLKTQAVGEANRLGRIALDKMLITQEQFEQALEVVQTAPEAKRLPDILFKLGFVTAAQRDTLAGDQSVPGSAPSIAGAPPRGPAAVVNTAAIKKIDWRLALVFNCVTVGILTWCGFLSATNNFWYRYHGETFCGVVALCSLVLTVVFSCMLLYKCWTVVANDTSPVSPTKAVGFLFIPFFNLYWMFVAFPKLSLLLNDHASALRTEKPTNYGLGMALAVLAVVAMTFGFLSGLVDGDREVENMLAGVGVLADLGSFVVWILFFKDVARVAEVVRVAGGGK